VTVIVRSAEDADMPEILAITNHAIAATTALWTDAPLTLAQRTAWMHDRKKAGFPVIVAADNDGAILGFGSYGAFRAFDGYRHTVEHSVYVAPSAQRRGIGRMLLDSLVRHAADAGHHVMIGAITADNAPSIALHQALAFAMGPVLPQVGRKFDRWLDLALMYRMLQPDSAPAGAPD